VRSMLLSVSLVQAHVSAVYTTRTLAVHPGLGHAPRFAPRMAEVAECEFSTDQIEEAMRRLPALSFKEFQEKGVELASEKRERAIKTLRERALLEQGEQAERIGSWKKSLNSVGVSSWYDAGVRLMPEIAVVEEADPLPDKGLTASAQASLFAGLFAALAVVGVDLASFGVVENLDAAVLVGGLALSQVDSASPVGSALRGVGGGAEVVGKEVVVPTTKAVGSFVKKNEVGLKTRAVLEIALENAILILNPKRKKLEKLEAAYKEKAASAARLRAERDGVPAWQLTERWALDDQVRAAEQEAAMARREVEMFD